MTNISTAISARSGADETNSESIGRIVVNFGSHLLLDDSNHRLLKGIPRGRKLKPVCGDSVRWQMTSDGQAMVTEVLPRRNELTRHDLRSSQRVLAANLDCMLVVMAATPDPDLELVDRYLVAAEVLGIEPALIFNKSDLLTAGERQQREQQLVEFEMLGYRLLWVSTRNGSGMDSLHEQLAGRTSIVVGQSGVGKSSLVNTLLPDIDLWIQAISSASGEGQHTTTATQLYNLPDGKGCIIDSPGVRDFRLWPMPATELSAGFRELRNMPGSCRFQDCRHLSEPQCEVKRLVAAGKISTRRYNSYQKLVEWSANT